MTTDTLASPTYSQSTAEPNPVQPPPATSWRLYAVGTLLLLVAGIVIGMWVMQYYQSFQMADRAAAASPAPKAVPVVALPPRPAVLAAPTPRPIAGGGDAVESQLEQASSQAARAEALLVAVAARRALDRGLSLGYIEPLLMSRFGASQPNAVQTIIAVSRAPVTLDTLRSRLEAVAPQLVSGTRSGGFWTSVRTELRELVVVRAKDSGNPLPTERMAQALRLLDSGRLDKAITEVEALGGKKIAPRWLDDARRYNEARRALDVIETAALVETRDGAE